MRNDVCLISLNRTTPSTPMALSTLSPPSSHPPFTPQYSSSAAALLPKLHHPSAAAPFPANNHSNSLSTSTPHKWRANVSFFTGLLNNNKAKNAEAIKQELLEAIDPLDRGAEATPEDQKLIDQVYTHNIYMRHMPLSNFLFIL